MSNSSSWSSTVVGADDEDPSRENEVGGEARTVKTRGESIGENQGWSELVAKEGRGSSSQSIKTSEKV